MDIRDRLIILYDYYKELLSETQKEYFEEYYFNNLSLGEIGENYDISRAAVYKNIKSTEDKLIFFENKLGMYHKKEMLDKVIKTIKDKELKNKLDKIFE